MKTIEKAIEMFVHGNRDDEILNFYNRGVLDGMESGIMLGIEYAQEWIDVDEELPTTCGFYLTKQSDNSKPHVYYFDCDYNGFFQGKGVQVFTVTHWRQIELK